MICLALTAHANFSYWFSLDLFKIPRFKFCFQSVPECTLLCMAALKWERRGPPLILSFSWKKIMISSQWYSHLMSAGNSIFSQYCFTCIIQCSNVKLNPKAIVLRVGGYIVEKSSDITFYEGIAEFTILLGGNWSFGLLIEKGWTIPILSFFCSCLSFGPSTMG